MANEIQWLESFTGLSATDGSAIPGRDPDSAAARYRFKKAQQQTMLNNVRKQLNEFKSDFQNAMSEKIKSGKLKGQRLLKESGTQIDEIEIEDISLADLELSKDSQKLIAKGATLVMRLATELETAPFTFQDEEPSLLFDQDELREEFWTPLMRERILPETYIPAQYSETQRMLDESNAAYLKRIEEEKAQGTLTPRLDRGKEILNSAGELLSLAGDMVGKFGAGTEQAKLAVSVLNTAAAVIQQGSEVYDQAQAGKFADASSTAFEALGGIATAVLGNCGIDAKVTGAVGKAFSAGSKSIQVGYCFSQGIDGAEEGLTLMGTVVQSALDTAAGLVDNPETKKGLLAAKATVPAAFKQAAIGLNLRQKIYDEDYAGIVGCLGESFANALSTAQELRGLQAKQGRTEEEQQKIQEQLDKQTGELKKYFDMGQVGVQLAIKAVITAKQGEYLDALNGVIDGIGGQLSEVLKAAGVDEKQATMIGQFYVAASSAPKALKCLSGPDFNVSGALDELSGGILIAFEQAAPDNKALQRAAGGLAIGLKSIGAGVEAQKLFKKGEYEAALTSVMKTLHSGIKGGLTLAKLDASEKETVVYEAVQTYLDMGEAGVEMAIKATFALHRKEYLQALNGVIDDIGGQLTAVLTKAGLAEDQAKRISDLYRASASAPKALQCLSSPQCDVQGALVALSSGIRIAFRQAAPGNDVLLKAGEGLAVGLETIGSGLKTKELFLAKNYGKALEAFVGGVKNGVGTGLKLGDVGEGEDKILKHLGDALELLQTTGELVSNLKNAEKQQEEEKQVFSDLKDAFKELSGDKIASNLEEAKKVLAETRRQENLEAMRAEAEDVLAEAMADADNLSEAQRFGAEASSIDKMVAKLQRDRMVFELAVQISQGGAAFLAKFVPALGAAAAGIKLAAQLHAAGLRAQQLFYWIRNQDDLEAAQSSLSSSAGNFVRNQGEQLAHYAAQAIFAAAQLAAEIVKLSGVAAPVGMGLDAAATAGAKLEEIARKHFRQEDLEKAWEVTAQALRNPTNRKLGLQARKLNPSLAKYAIAWGATELRDPLARNALRACNLTEASLQDKDSDVDKVVRYLETFYSDDLTLYRELDETPEWVPKELSLTLASWTRLKRLSVSSGMLKEVPTSRIDGALAQLDTLAEGPAWKKFNEAIAAWRITAKSVESTSSGTTTDQPSVKPDNKLVLEAIAEVEIEVSVKTRMVADLRKNLENFDPEGNPDAPKYSEKAAAESVKAIKRAIKVLVDQANVLERTATGEMQTVVELRMRFAA